MTTLPPKEYFHIFSWLFVYTVAMLVFSIIIHIWNLPNKSIIIILFALAFIFFYYAAKYASKNVKEQNDTI